MQKVKLILVILIIAVFALFVGMEAKDFGDGQFTKAFITTLVFGLGYALVTTVLYIGAKVQLLKEGQPDTFANPLDIWLLSIPFVVLMIIAYLFLKWYVAEVFFCTMMSLSGMLFANNLGRGSGRWRVSKSLPFFFGCVVTIVYGIVIGGML